MLFDLNAMTLVLQGIPGSATLAYIDPGSGSLLLQLLLAGALSMGYFVRSNLLSVRSYFKKSDKSDA